MTTFPNSPRLLKGGIVLLNPETAVVRRIISLRYNPDTLTRSLQIQGVNAEGGGTDRSEILRLKGPPVETIKLDAESDATDQLEFQEQNPQSNAAWYLLATDHLGDHLLPTSFSSGSTCRSQTNELKHQTMQEI